MSLILPDLIRSFTISLLLSSLLWFVDKGFALSGNTVSKQPDTVKASTIINNIINYFILNLPPFQTFAPPSF